MTFESDVFIAGSVYADIATEHNVFIYGQNYGRVTGGTCYYAVYCVPGESGSLAFASEPAAVDIGVGVPFVPYGALVTFSGQPNAGYRLDSVSCDKFSAPIPETYTVFSSAAYWGNFVEE